MVAAAMVAALLAITGGGVYLGSAVVAGLAGDLLQSGLL